MATKFEYYDTGADNELPIDDTRWYGQTFTPSTAHTITSVKVSIHKAGSPTGNINCSIKATDADGLPTGDDLATSSVDVSTLGTSSSWIEFDLGSGAELSANTTYALLLWSNDFADPNEVHWDRDATSPTYTGGNQVASTDDGATWTANTTDDCYFEEWGNPLATGGKMSLKSKWWGD